MLSTFNIVGLYATVHNKYSTVNNVVGGHVLVKEWMIQPVGRRLVSAAPGPCIITRVNSRVHAILGNSNSKTEKK